MSETDPSASGSPDERQVKFTPELYGEQPTLHSRVDGRSLLEAGKWFAALAIVSVGLTALAEGVSSHTDGSDEHSSTTTNSSSATPHASTNPEAESQLHCREVSGVLRIVGVNAEQVKAINDQDDVGTIPHMYHQRDAEGNKADVKFEWRTSGSINDAAFYTAARYHFRPYTERSDEPMLGADDVVIPGNAYNLQGAVGEIVEVGHMKYCEEGK